LGCRKVSLKQFLKEEVKPALGCTEPVAVALAVARAREELEGKPDRVEVVLSSNVFKNGATVGIPGSGGLKGNEVAAALALVSGKSEYGLEVLKDCGPDDVEVAMKLLRAGAVEVSVDREISGVFVHARVKNDAHSASCTIEKNHANIAEVKRDDAVVSAGSSSRADGTCGISAADAIATMRWDEVMGYLEEADEADLAFLLDGVKMNLAIAEKGFEPGVGLGAGRMIRDMSSNFASADLGEKIKAWSGAASDARMSGIPMPVMSSAGSGNHGITAILPVALFASEKGMSEEKTARGLLVSHLATAYVKSRTGRLSSTCGCAFAAGAGAAAGMAWLMSEDTDKAKAAVEIVVSNLIGMLCDGAKETCAFKVGTGAMEAYHAALMADRGTKLEVQGVVGVTIEETIENAARVASSMGAIEQTLIDIVEERK
jgi:L-cysteine desulfidase